LRLRTKRGPANATQEEEGGLDLVHRDRQRGTPEEDTGEWAHALEVALFP
jgi:hypothetical protein